MKSQVKRLKSDNLIFQWDQKLQMSKDNKKNLKTEDNNLPLLDEYFNFLSEIKPHKQELKATKIFETPFTI